MRHERLFRLLLVFAMFIPSLYINVANVARVAAATEAVETSSGQPADPAPEVSPDSGAAPITAGKEVIAARTATSRTYQQGANGGYVATISSAPINYQDANGDWQPIENTLVPSRQPGYAYQNKANQYTLQLPNDLKDAPVRVTKGDASVAFSLAGSTGAGSVSGAVDTFANALPGVDVGYQASNNAVKESLILQGPESPHTFVYNVQVSPGLTARAADDGGIDFVDAAGKVAFSFAPPYMSDSAATPETPYAVTMTPKQTPDGLTVTVDADPTWLADPARVWPVIIDPTVTLNPSQDCWVGSSSPTHSYCSAIGISVIVSGGAIGRGLLKFDMSSIPATAQVSNAKMGLRGNGSTGITAAVGAYKVTQDWTNSATWNTYDGTNAWASPGGDFDPTLVSTTNVSTNAWYYWSVTPIVQGWVDGSSTNAGILLKEPLENVTDTISFVSSNDVGYPSDWPTLTVTYFPRMGVQRFYTYEDHKLTDHMDLKVNVANGNLMLHQTDTTIQGTGLNETVDRTYNSLDSRVGSFGDFWTIGSGPDVQLVTYADGSVDLNGPTGYITSFTKNSSGVYISPTGIDATLTKPSSTYVLTFLKTGEKYNFNSAGRLATDVDKNGNTITYTYNASNQLTKITDTQGRATTVTYNPTWGTIASITDSTGRKHQYSYFNYQLVQYIDPAGKTTSYTYTGYDLAKITDPVGNETRMVYDTKHRVTSITSVTNTGAGTGPTTTFTYNAGNTVVTDPNGHQTTYTYDAVARVTRIVDALGNISDTDYTPNSDRKQVTDAMGGTTTYTYDSNNNMTSLGVPSGGTTNIMYTDSSHPYYPTERDDPEGKKLQYTYDTKGNITQIKDDLSTQNILKYTYTTQGMVSTATDALLHVTTYSYDFKGNLTKIAAPAPLGAVTIVPDALSRVSSITDGKGQKTTYTYDLLDRVTTISYAGGASISRVFDDDGNLTSQTDATGTSSFSYDALNRLTGKTLPGGATISYTYDDAGNLTSVHDAAGTVAYTYNAANELTALTEPGGTTQTTFTYDANHNRTSTAYPNGVTMTMSYDSSNRLIGITGKDSLGTVLSSYSYSFAQPGTGTDTNQRYTMTDTAGNVTTYTYDALNRLLEAQTKDSGGTVIDDYQYTYDGAGNRTQQTVNGTTTSYAYNAANELTSDGTSSYTYDANGNLTGSSAGLSLSYNSLNQTASITPPGGSAIGMSYTGDSQVERVTAGTTTYANNALGLSVAVDASGTTGFIRDNQGKLTEERTPSGNYYYLFDGLGSVVALTDSSGAVVNTYSYDPYGNTKSSTGTVANPWQFGGSYGAYHDADTGLYKIGARYYSPELARWTQQDPVAHLYDPVQLNRYAYAGCNPSNVTDPTGTYCERQLLELFLSTMALFTPIGWLWWGALLAWYLTSGDFISCAQDHS